jgi:hypothetical protein
MRKLILSLVFVLATGSTLMNANSITEVKNSNQVETVAIDCIGLAFALEEIFGEMEYETFLKVVDSCESM